MELYIVFYGIIILVSLIGIVSRFIPGFKTDNKIEEVSEHIIKMKTGVNVDLSPDTPDPDNETPPAYKKSPNK